MAAPNAAVGPDCCIVFDGGSLGNPGKGYGSFRLRPAGADWSPPVRLEFGRGVTNNEAEYRSLLAAFDAAAAIADPGTLRIEVFGDSQLVLRQLAGAWKVKAENLRPLYLKGKTAAARFKAVRYTWQPRNKSVDLLGH